MREIVIDLETSIKNRGEGAIGDHKAAPWHHDNKIVMIGTMVDDYIHTGTFSTREISGDTKGDLWIGHNIKFDIHYLMRDFEGFRENIFPHITLWDTQLAEYLLTAQTVLYPSLDECSLKYGGTLKDDRIKEFWNSDVDTEDIPPDMLKEYLIHDLKNTKLVYEEQLRLAVAHDMLPLITSQMDALKATIEMEYNGMYFDKKMAKEMMAPLQKSLEMLSSVIYDNLRHAHIENPVVGSNQHIGWRLFGGKQKCIRKVPMLDEDGNPILYKSGYKRGQVRTKNEEYINEIVGIFEGQGEYTEAGNLKTDDETLRKFTHPFVDHVLRYRELSKEITTYYQGYSDLVWRTDDRGGIIHQSLNHTATNTGRLSCTKPNLQNVTSAE